MLLVDQSLTEKKLQNEVSVQLFTYSKRIGSSKNVSSNLYGDGPVIDI